MISRPEWVTRSSATTPVSLRVFRNFFFLQKNHQQLKYLKKWAIKCDFQTPKKSFIIEMIILNQIFMRDCVFLAVLHFQSAHSLMVCCFYSSWAKVWIFENTTKMAKSLHSTFFCLSFQFSIIQKLEYIFQIITLISNYFQFHSFTFFFR